MTPLDRLAAVVELAEWADGWRDVAEALLDVARAAQIAAYPNYRNTAIPDELIRALTALDSAITKELGARP